MTVESFKNVKIFSSIKSDLSPKLKLRAYVEYEIDRNIGCFAIKYLQQFLGDDFGKAS